MQSRHESESNSQVFQEQSPCPYFKDNRISSIEYLIYCRGEKFRTIEFQKACKFKNRESARKYLNRLIETGLIKRIPINIKQIIFFILI